MGPWGAEKDQGEKQLGKKILFILATIHDHSLKDDIQDNGLELLKCHPVGSRLC